MTERPDIQTIKTGTELKRWYWLKAELLDEIRRRGLKQAGQKFDLLDRLAHFLDTGERDVAGQKAPRVTSKFDWHSAKLTPDTLITDSYKNSQNVRRFFKSEIGDSFKFSIAFMAWIKANVGRPLSDAVAEYHRLQEIKAQDGYQSDIAHHNQFNQYTRDMLEDRPESSPQDVRKVWAWKRARPSENGRHIYHADDLVALRMPD